MFGGSQCRFVKALNYDVVLLALVKIIGDNPRFSTETFLTGRSQTHVLEVTAHRLISYSGFPLGLQLFEMAVDKVVPISAL